MTIIYTMTFGSFIGFSMTFIPLTKQLFEVTDAAGNIINVPPNYMVWAFWGPVLGALVRPLGGMLADKVNSGAKVTMWSTIFQILAALGVAYFVVQSKGSATPEDNWWGYFGCFMILFITTGIGNGSTFRSVPYIFPKEKAGAVLGWTSAIAAYGAFIIPIVFKEQVGAGTAEVALYGFAGYYAFCLLLNWWYYQGPKREFDNP